MSSISKPGLKGPGGFSFITLGCKSNQYDSAAMASDLEKEGLTRTFLSEADIVVVNTCMVTGSTEAQCRKAVRRARRDNPGATIVVAGCMSAGSREQLDAMEEVDLVIEPRQKGQLPGLLGVGKGGEWGDWPREAAVELDERDRGFLKVQDGCDASCAYCIVPSVRGGARSLPPERVLDAVGKLMARGFSEVVLSGIHLGQYGSDLVPRQGLETLLNELLEADLPGRLRLSSVEPLEITGELVRILASAGGKICRHLHIPLQSGSDQILHAMGRPYAARDFVRAVDLLRESVPGIGIGCDVICGFPGESPEDFRKTCHILDSLNVPFLHAFPYSPRPGTRAASMKDDVPDRIKKERVGQLRELARARRREFAASFTGQVLETALQSRENPSGSLPGLTDNYLPVLVKPHPLAIPGSLVRVFLGDLEGDVLKGEVEEHGG